MDILSIIESIRQNPGIAILYSAITILSINSIRLLFKGYFQSSREKALKKRAEMTVDIRNIKIEKFISLNKKEVSSDKQTYILNLSATELCQEIKNQKVTAKEAFITYAIRAGTIGRDLYLIADADFEDGFQLAKEADELIKNTPNKNDLPELIGLPISIKDHIRVYGLRSTKGFLCNCENIDAEDSYIITKLKEKGAIPLCKSNIPQGLLTFESSCRLWGYAQNPWNKKKTPGGSSGGESGLVSSKCSPLGLGTDIGGSIRTPANFCGIYGFKPSIRRFSASKFNTLNNTNYTGFNTVEPSTGPIAYSHEDLVLLCKALFGEFPDDYQIMREKFNVEEYEKYAKSTKKLRIGFNYSVARTETAPGIVSDIEKTLAKLKQQGHEIIHFDYSFHLPVLDQGVELVFNSGKFTTMLQHLNGESLMDFYKSVKQSTFLPPFVVKILARILWLFGDKRMAEIMLRLKKYNSLTEFYSAVATLNQLKDKFYCKFKESKLDCLILPVTPFPALEIGMANITPANIFYTMMLNILDLPSGSIPTGLLKDNSYDSAFKDNMRIEIENSIKTSLNLPIGFQVATLPLEDEKCLGIMKMIDDLVKKDKEKVYKEYLSTNPKEVEYYFDKSK